MKSLSQRPRPGAFRELQRCAASHGTSRPARTRRGALWMQLNRHDARSGRDERMSYLSSSGTDVEN
jgi:hypothetical protein